MRFGVNMNSALVLEVNWAKTLNGMVSNFIISTAGEVGRGDFVLKNVGKHVILSLNFMVA